MAAKTPKAPKPFAGSKPVKRAALAKATRTPGTSLVRIVKPGQPITKATRKPAGQSQINKSEKIFKGSKSSGNIAKDKAKVANKTGVWPNGMTN